MFLKRHLDSFKIYIILLIISTSIVIRGIPEFPVINFITYLFIHILLIYIGFYYFNITLYFVFFVTGIIFDIFLLNEIGPHIVTFMILIIFLNQFQRFLIILSSKKIFILIILILFSTYVFEMFFSLILFNYNFVIYDFVKKNIYLFVNFISFILSFQ